MSAINVVCVIGSGVMGSGIAAQIANSRTKVILLDIADKNSTDKNTIVKSAFEKLFSQKPAPLSHPDYAQYIQIGNLDDDLDAIKEADLVIEVIVEKLEIKHSLYNSILPYLKPSAILASNTSTLPLKKLKEQLPDEVKKRFIITHFFNPPRYLELLELVTDQDTSLAIIPEISQFLTKKLGKTIVNCNDTPGFIANRVGCFLLELVVRKALINNLDPVIIDQIFSKYLGFPATGIFGLYDLIGHDVMALISNSLLSSLPQNDLYHQIYQPVHVLEQMATAKLLGRKTGAGFYKISKDSNGNTKKEVISLDNLQYVEASLNSLPYANLEQLIDTDDKYGKFIDDVLTTFFKYITSLIPSVTEHPDNIDEAMKLGYNLKFGPFELMQRLSINNSGSYVSNNKILPNIGTKFLETSEKAIMIQLILENKAADFGTVEDRYIFRITSKMNVLDNDVFNLLVDAIAYCEARGENLYIYPRGSNFSAGANLLYLKNCIENKDIKSLETFIHNGQKAMMAIKYAKIPVIACARGVALGGGCEILLHSSVVIGHQNLNAGLVELGVGLIPGWGGVKEMFLRSKGDKKELLKGLGNILWQNKSSSCYQFGQDYMTKCKENMNKNFLFREAMTMNLDGFKPINVSSNIELPKIDLKSEFDTSAFNALQLDVLEFLQTIINQQSVSEELLLGYEKEKFAQLAFRPLALENIKKVVAPS